MNNWISLIVTTLYMGLTGFATTALSQQTTNQMLRETRADAEANARDRALTADAKAAAAAAAAAKTAADMSSRVGLATSFINKTAKVLAEPETDSFKILRYVESAVPTDVRLVMIKGGKDDGIVDGALFKAYRRAASPAGKPDEFVWVETGTLKAVRLDKDFTIAQILTETSLESRVFFIKHPGIMAGDWVKEHKVNLAQRQIITPTTTLEYHHLFEDPKAYPASFELHEKGRLLLVQMAEQFAKARLPLLMVEAYTDVNGPSDANQVESYQRALTIRHFLVEELGFDADRVIAIGYGEGEPIDSNFVPGYEQKNRRIVLKIKSLAGDN